MGTISGAAWTGAGKYGKALSFDGVNDIVNVPDANSLDLTSGLTLSAWVYPTTQTSWHTVIMKETQGDLAYALYSNSDRDSAVDVHSSRQRAEDCDRHERSACSTAGAISLLPMTARRSACS